MRKAWVYNENAEERSQVGRRPGREGYWIGWYDDSGHRRARSFRTLTLARKKVRQLHARWDAAEVGEPIPVSWTDLVDAYLEEKLRAASTTAMDRRTFHTFGQICGYPAASDITPALIERFKKRRLEGELDGDGVPVRDAAKPATVNKDLRALRALFNWAVERGYMRACPIGRNKAGLLRVPHRDPEEFRPEEVHRIVSACTFADWKVLIVLALNPGLRKSDLLNLQVSDFRADQAVILCTERKTHQQRLVPLHPNVVDLLNAWILQLPDGETRLFREGGMENHFHTRRWITALKSAGVPYRKFHSLRATASTWMQEAGFSGDVASFYLGHSRRGVTQRHYTNLQRLCRQAVAKLPLDFVRDVTRQVSQSAPDEATPQRRSAGSRRSGR